MNYYPFTKKDFKKRDGYWYDLYTFKGANNHCYFIEVEHRDHGLKVVKFYLKQHRLSKNRYFLVLKNTYSGNQTGAAHFIKVLNTLLKLSEQYYQANETVSFGFMGAPKMKEKECTENKDGTFNATQRFRIYRTLSLNYFSEERFDHIEFKSSSCYLIRNKRNETLTLEVAKDLLRTYLND